MDPGRDGKGFVHRFVQETNYTKRNQITENVEVRETEEEEMTCEKNILKGR